MFFVRLIAPLFVGYLANLATSAVTGFACPLADHTMLYNLVCVDLWPQLAQAAVTAITYIRTHPNGLLGDSADRVDFLTKLLSSVLSPVKLAPPVPPPPRGMDPIDVPGPTAGPTPG